MRQYTDQQKFAEVYRHEYGHRIDDNFLRYLPENKRKQIMLADNCYVENFLNSFMKLAEV